ncbi:hypothetical protein CL622_04635 [archaeon]|nr:hypothetical protein [archaeon]
MADESSMTCRAIIEIAGYPKEHVTSIMGKVVGQVKGTGQVKTTAHRTFPAKLVKQENVKEMYSTFTEFDLEVGDISYLADFAFSFMPSSIEILDGKDTFTSAEFNGIINDLLARLHNYDMVVKNLQAEKLLLQRALKKEKESTESKPEAKES